MAGYLHNILIKFYSSSDIQWLFKKDIDLILLITCIALFKAIQIV